MNTVIVTEGNTDKQLLALILKDIINQDSIIVAGGWSSANALARSILITDRVRIAVVVDADTQDALEAEKRRLFMISSMNQINPMADKYVLVLRPQLEVLLMDSQILHDLLQREVSFDELHKLTSSDNPKAVLEKFAGEKFATILSRISEADAALLKGHPEIQGLISFIQHIDNKIAA